MGTKHSTMNAASEETELKKTNEPKVKIPLSIYCEIVGLKLEAVNTYTAANVEIYVSKLYSKVIVQQKYLNLTSNTELNESQKRLTFSDFFNLLSADGKEVDKEMLDFSFVISEALFLTLQKRQQRIIEKKAKKAEVETLIKALAQKDSQFIELNRQLEEVQEKLAATTDKAKKAEVETLTKALAQKNSQFIELNRQLEEAQAKDDVSVGSQPTVAASVFSVSCVSNASQKQAGVEKANGVLKTEKAFKLVLSSMRWYVIDKLCKLVKGSVETNGNQIVLRLVCALLSAAITEPTKKTREIVNEQKKQLGFSEESELAESINACFPSTLTNVISSRPSDDNKKFSALEQLKYQVLLTMIFSEKANYLFSLDGKIALNSKLSQEMKNAYEAKLTQLMTVVLTPVCIATIQALRELPLSDSTISLSKRYTLICQLITAAVTDKKIVQIIMQENQIDLEKLVGKKENLGLDSLDDEPSSQDKKDFMECFAYVIHELPRYLLQAPPTITFKQLVTFSSENKTYVAALVNAAKQLPSLAEGDENAEETPIKRRYPVSGVKA